MFNLTKAIKVQANLQVIAIIINMSADFVAKSNGADINTKKFFYIVLGVFTVFQILLTLWIRRRVKREAEYPIKGTSSLSHWVTFINLLFLVTIYLRWIFIE
ncbi:MAG: hypothetical protein ACRDA4_03710 [Filifactoraceae bacterium]